MSREPHELLENFLQKHLPHQTVIASGPHETTIKNDPGVEVCDFCGLVAQHIPHTYAANDIDVDTVVVIDEQGPIGSTYQSIGDWGACDPCAALINTNNRGGLLERAYQQFINRWDAEVPPHMIEKARRLRRHALKTSHDAFFASRK